ncbi:MAG TPA: hypothetical protein VJ843_01545 [Candidatus Saccharimonadales bacterium]|nr:hypothetical protein [Candidatus Saccharimonadales bacterium]
MQHSKFYKDDGIIVIPDVVRRYLDEHLLPELQNMQATNPKLLVVFSGGNAMGKSTISGRLAADLQALVLNNDRTRHLLATKWPSMHRDEVNRYMWQYMLELYQRLDTLTPNGLVVRDGVIDWYYDKIFPIFEAQGYRIFIIAFDLSRQKRIDLVTSRGDTHVAKVDGMLEMIDDLIVYEKLFRAQYEPDITLTDDNLFDHDRVVQAVQKRLSQLT